MPWAWRSVWNSGAQRPRATASISSPDYGKLERFLDQRAGGTGDELPPGGRSEVAGGNDQASEEIRSVLRQPIVELDP